MWAQAARETIAKVHRLLPEGATLPERKAAVDAAYPFGARDYWPYKAWCKARKAYLVPYGYKPRTPIRKSPRQLAFDLLPSDPATGRPVIG